MFRPPLSSLRARLVLLVLLAGIPSLVLVLYNRWAVRVEKEEQAREELARSAQAIADQQAMTLDFTHTFLDMLPRVPDYQPPYGGSRSNTLTRLMRMYPEYINLSWIATNGSVIASAAPFDESLNVADLEWFPRAVASGHFVLSDCQTDKITGKPAINFVHLVHGEKHQLEMLLVATFNLNWFNKATTAGRLPAQAIVTLADRNGTILTRSQEMEKWAGQPLPGSLARANAGGKLSRGFLTSVGMDSVERVYAFQRVGGGFQSAGLYAFVGLPTQMIYAEAREQTRVGVLATLLVFALALLAAWVGSDLLVLRHVGRLLTATRALSAGDWKARTGMRILPKQQDEIHELGRAFDLMASQFEADRERLRQSEEKFRALVEQAADGIFLADRTGRYMDVNPRASTLTGRSREELLQMRMEDLLTPEELPRLAPALEELQRAGNTTSEWHLRRKNGTLVTVEIASSRLTDGRVQWIVRDLSEWERTQAVTNALAELGWRLSSASTPEAAARTVMEIADRLLGWDAGFVHWYSPDLKEVFPILSVDTVDGQRRDVPSPPASLKSVATLRGIEPKLILRDLGKFEPDGFIPFGDTSRPSASLMYVPIRFESRVIGTLSIQSYSVNAYTEAGLSTLQSLADHCGGALQRLWFESRLVQEQQLLRTLVDNLPVCVYVKDRQGRYLLNNLPNTRLLDKDSESEVLGSTVFDLFPADLARLYDEDDRRVIESGQAQINREEPFLTADGRRGWFLTSKVPLRDAQGRIFAVVGISQDITERKHAEDAIKESRARLYTALESLPFDFWICDANSRYVVQNSTSIKHWGNLLGKTPEEVGLPEDITGVWRENYRRALAGEIVRREVEHTHDGVQRFFQSIVAPISDGEKIRGTLGVNIDITERRRAEQDSLRLAVTVQQAAESIVILSRNGVVEYANPAFSRVTGRAAGELAGRMLDALLPGRSQSFVFADAAQTVAKSGLWTGHFSTQDKSGLSSEQEATLSAIRDSDGKLVNYVAILRDVTKEAALEEQVRLAQKMEAIGLLAGGVAHDFNNILQVIQGFALLAKSAENPAESREHLDQVLQAAERAAQLTKQLLAFGRRQPLQKDDLDLNTFMLEMTNMIQRLIGEHIEVQFLPGQNLGNIRGDKNQLNQVLLNLCVNARDAMPKGGRLTIETTNILFDGDFLNQHPLAKPGPHVLLKVTDTGVGMDRETLSRIFEPFFTTKSIDKGTGLGLAVVYGIIQQHDGMIQVYSEPDLGTTFKIYFPTTEPGVTTTVAKSETGPLMGTGTILLAEDEPAVRELARHVLTEAGYHVLVANNGEEACALFEQHGAGIDLLLFDVVMPRMGGREAYDRIRAQKPDVRVLFSSGYSGTALQSGGALLEGVELLEKPYAVRELLVRVQRLIAGSIGTVSSPQS
jgi:PAS domain S-box-containing protein